MRVRASATTLEAEMAPEQHQLLFTVLAELLDQPVELSDAVLEIGTAAGGTLVAMMKRFPSDQRPKFVVVDEMTYFPNQLQRVKENLRLNSLNPDDVEFRIGRSHLLFEEASERCDRFSLILIDAYHKLRYVMWDLRWARFLAVGGFVCLHDCLPKSDVACGVDRFLARNSACYKKVGLARSLIAIRKVAAPLSNEVDTWDIAYAQIMGPIRQLWRNVRNRIER